MKVKAVLAGLGVLSVVTLGTVKAADASVSWTARTCAAEQLYVKHPATVNLDTMVTDSFHVPWKYVGEDASGLYADVRGGKTKYISKDEKYFAEDCK